MLIATTAITNENKLTYSVLIYIIRKQKIRNEKNESNRVKVRTRTHTYTAKEKSWIPKYRAHFDIVAITYTNQFSLNTVYFR